MDVLRSAVDSDDDSAASCDLIFLISVWIAVLSVRSAVVLVAKASSSSVVGAADGS
jgi:hypothetical protein